MPLLVLLGRLALWLSVFVPTVGRVADVPTRPLVPAVGLVLVLGRAVAPFPVLAEALPDKLLVVGRLVVIWPLIEPLDGRDTLALPWVRPPLFGRRLLIDPAMPLLLRLTLAT